MNIAVLSKPEPILVPYWIINILNRNKLPFSKILDLEEMLKVASKEDLAIMLSMNDEGEQQSKFFGVPTESSLDDVWNRFYNIQFKSIKEIIPLISNSIDSRLSISESPYPSLFDVKYVTSEGPFPCFMLIVINPGYFGGDNIKETQKSLVRKFLSQSYVFTDYDIVARGNLFKQYMRTSISDTE